MRITGIRWSLSRPPILLAGAIALIMASCANGDATARKAALTKAAATQTQEAKPVKLRYYGGPKYPMYPQ
jgi:hypothetical protein